MRRILLIIAMVAAVLGPYLWSNPQAAGRLGERVTSFFGGKSGAGSNGAWEDWSSSDSHGGGPGFGLLNAASLDTAGTTVAGESVADFAEVFRFNVTPGWVSTRWPRVTTVVDSRGLQGMRVVLVTGSSPTDLAGSLTYYFDHQQYVRRITFRGTSGDASRLSDLIVKTYELKREPVPAADVFARRASDKASAMLVIQRAPVMRADAPFERYQIDLELTSPRDGITVDPELLAWLGPATPAKTISFPGW